MAHHLWSLDVYWDGHRLVAHPAFHDGWEQLGGTSPKQPLPVKAMCNEVEDLTAFELGVFLGLAVRPFTDEWRSEPELFHAAVVGLPRVSPTA